MSRLHQHQSDGPLQRPAAIWALLTLLLLQPVVPAQAAQTTARVFVSIVGTASAVSTGTSLTVGLTDAAPATSSEAADGTASEDTTTQGSSAAPLPTTSQPAPTSNTFDLGGDVSLPGSFSVVGASGQVFSVQLPSQVVLDVGGELVELSGFQHDGGTTPTADANGILEICFSAEVNRDQATVLQNLVSASGTDVGEEEIVILQVAQPDAGDGADANPAAGTGAESVGEAVAGATVPASPGGATRIAVRVADPFKLPTDSNRQVVIVISFN